MRNAVIAHLRPMLEAQIAHAQGLKYLVVRNSKTGKVVRVTEMMAKAKLGKDEEIIEVWEKDPNVLCVPEEELGKSSTDRHPGRCSGFSRGLRRWRCWRSWRR